MDYQNLRSLRGRVTQWTGKIVDQLLDSKDSPGSGPTPPPPPNPPYNTHPQYAVNQQYQYQYQHQNQNQHPYQYQYNPNPQDSPNPQFGWSPPQYGSNYQQFPQAPINGNGQNYSQGVPPSPNPLPEDALRLRFNVFNVSQYSTILSYYCLHSLFTKYPNYRVCHPFLLRSLEFARFNSESSISLHSFSIHP